jgi:hypothetical protein
MPPQVSRRQLVQGVDSSLALVACWVWLPDQLLAGELAAQPNLCGHQSSTCCRGLSQAQRGTGPARGPARPASLPSGQNPGAAANAFTVQACWRYA